MNVLKRLVRLAGASLVIVILAGCGRSFYISESDAASFRSALSTPLRANELFRDLHDRSLQIQFDSSGPTPRVTSTNVVQTVRALQLLAAFEGNRWVRLDRLSSQLEEQLTAWANDRLVLLSSLGGSTAKIEKLDHANVVFVTAPTLTYDANQQSIDLNAHVAVGIKGTVNINLLSDFLNTVCSVPNPFCSNVNGLHSLSISLDLPVDVNLQFLNSYVDPATVRIRITPTLTPQSVNVASNNNDVSHAVQQLIVRQLSPVDEVVALGYNNFTLSRVGIQDELSATYHALPNNVEPQLDVVFRNGDGNLYHARRQAGAWGAPNKVPLPEATDTDPALAVAEFGRLDLIAVTDQGHPVYASWRDGTWRATYASRNGRPNERYLSTQKPALLATAPGQLELMLIGTDGQFWHLRRLNGNWLAPSRIPVTGSATPPQPPFRDPVAVQSGNQVVLLFVDHRNRLFGSTFNFDTTAWAPPWAVPTQGSVSFAPAIASCGDGRIDVVYVGGGRHPFHRVLQFGPSANIALGNETAIGGTLSAGPALTCSGYQRLELVGRGTDNVAYHNHFVGPADFTGVHENRQLSSGWQGWEQLSAVFFGTPFSSGQIAASLALASTRSGEVHLLAIQNGSGAQSLFSNSYDSNRFGVTAWSAVGWRGFEQPGSISSIGRPALAISDQQLEIAFALQNGIGLAKVTSSGLPQPERRAALTGSSVVLSSGPGSVDVITPNVYTGLIDGSLHNSAGVTTTFASTTGSFGWSEPHIVTVAAVSSGIGLIDAVGVGQDNSLYHYRRIGGEWLQAVKVPFTVSAYAPSPPPAPEARITGTPREPGSPTLPQPIHHPQPNTVPGAVLSSPVLVSTGAGQLELCAIGTRTYGRGEPLNDRTLYHWRFAGGAWSQAQQVEWDRSPSVTYFGQSAASSAGDGTVDLIVIQDGTGTVFHTRFLAAPVSGDSVISVTGNTPSPPKPVFTEIGGSAIDVPVLASLSTQKLALLEIGTDGYAYENWAIPVPAITGRIGRTWTPTQIALGINLAWSGFRPLASTPISVGEVAKVGANGLAAVAADPDGRTYLNRFVGLRWTGFVPMPAPGLQTAPAQNFKPLIIVH